MVEAFGNALDGDIVLQRVFEVNGERFFHQRSEHNGGIPCEEVKDGRGFDTVVECEVSRAVRAFTAGNLGDTLLQSFIEGEGVVDTALFGSCQTLLIVIDEDRNGSVVDKNLAQDVAIESPAQHKNMLTDLDVHCFDDVFSERDGFDEEGLFVKVSVIERWRN